MPSIFISVLGRYYGNKHTAMCELYSGFCIITTMEFHLGVGGYNLSLIFAFGESNGSFTLSGIWTWHQGPICTLRLVYTYRQSYRFCEGHL